MLLDFEVQRCTRRCAATERDGEWFYSVLVSEGADVRRRDFATEAWNEPAKNCIGWWKSRLPVEATGKAKLAPNEVLLELFDRWADEFEKQDARYVLTLLLVRRRVLRIEETAEPTVGGLHVFCPRRETNYQVPAVDPTLERIAEIQQELAELLYAGN
jgi:hypothetical protein